MTTRITPPQWEALSSYLDNQLTPKERARLETHLKQDAELRQALEDLRRTRALLRSQPRLRAPRNFTLTPAMAGVRSGARRSSSVGTYPILRLASVLATIFFVLVTVGDFAVRTFAPPPLTMTASERAAAPVFGMGGGGGGGGGALQPEMGLLAPTEAPVEAITGQAAASPIPDQKSLVVTPMGTPEAALEALVTPEAVAQAKEVPIQPADNGNRQLENETQQPAAQHWPAHTVILVLQILLIILAVGAGLAALYVRRAAR